MALIFDIKVVPQSGKQKCIIDKTGTLKCYLKSAPEAGKANKELVKMISKKMKVTLDEVTILLGATSRKKRIKIEGDITQEALYAALGIEQQLSITES